MHHAPRLVPAAPLILLAFVVSTAHGAEGGSEAAAQAEAITLALRPTVGSVYHTETIADQTITQTVQGIEQTVEQKTTIGNRMEVTASEGAHTTIAITITRVAVEQSAPGQPAQSYDSQAADQAVPAAMKPLAALPETRYTITCDRRGSVIASEGLDGLVDKLAASMADTLPPQQLEMVKEQTRKQFGKQAMEQSAESLLAHHPEQPVRPGDSWKREIAINMGFAIEVDSEYVLQEHDADRAVAELSSGMTAAQGEMQMGPMTVKPDLSGTQTGTVIFDRASGWPVQLDLEQTVEGSLHMDAQGRSMEIPMKVRMTMSHRATLQTDTGSTDDEAPATATDDAEDAEDATD